VDGYTEGLKATGVVLMIKIGAFTKIARDVTQFNLSHLSELQEAFAGIQEGKIRIGIIVRKQDEGFDKVSSIAEDKNLADFWNK